MCAAGLAAVAVAELLDIDEPDEELLIAPPLDCANAVPATNTKPAARVINVRCMKSLLENVENANRLAVQ